MGGQKNRGVFGLIPTLPFDSLFSSFWEMEVVGFVRGGGGFCVFGFSWLLALERHWRIRKAGKL